MESKSFGNKNRLNRLKWSDLYSDSLPTLPIFLPVSYNISKGLPAISSPYFYDVPERLNYYSILDQLAKEGKNNNAESECHPEPDVSYDQCQRYCGQLQLYGWWCVRQWPFGIAGQYIPIDVQHQRQNFSPVKRLFSLPWRTEELKLPRKSSHHN
ncbi:MAG: hypothetical protein IPN97_17500 [Saprospiraceae bacterium]|nr:hypothetical protein [Saprospiraceae bacterium]